MEARAEWHSSAVCGKPPTTTELLRDSPRARSLVPGPALLAKKEFRACCANPTADLLLFSTQTLGVRSKVWPDC